MAMARTADGVEIWYDTIGAGRDVVLVHGITDSSGTWGEITPALAEHYRVTTLDLRGHGHSGDAPSYEAVQMAADVAAVVDAAGLVEPLLVGHSLGGIVVTAYAASSPLASRGVVNVDQPLQLSAFQAGLAPAEGLLRDPASFGPVLSAVFESMDGSGMTAAVREHITAHRNPRQDVVLGVWDAVFTQSVAQLDELVATMIGRLSAPYLALQYMPAPDGYDDWLRALIPQAVVETWPDGTGHYEHLLDPGAFVARLTAFDAQPPITETRSLGSFSDGRGRRGS
ncbi:MAG TPA: alpha/beta hydrolase [Ilumatobacteraceae bacterium]|nr:alpha/beta hydrolase [Ilumatobacteraceae bacterium]